MIVPTTAQHAAAVADHDDELDPIYRQPRVGHVHHGLWTTRRETPVDDVGDRLRSMGAQEEYAAMAQGTRRLALVGRDRVFALSLPRLLVAHRTGAMRCGILTLERP